MNGQSAQAKQTEYPSQWQEAQRCKPNRQIICEPKPECEPHKREVIRERDSKETFIFMNSAESIERNSDRELRLSRRDAVSWLTWGLLGLASLLFLGSLLTLLLAANRGGSTTIKEITNNNTKSREIVRVERADDDSRHYYYPKARW